MKLLHWAILAIVTSFILLLLLEWIKPVIETKAQRRERIINQVLNVGVHK